MTDKEKMLGVILSRIADEINITPTMQEKAVKSYQAVGEWLGDGIKYDVRIMPQGSMNLGTVIRPIDDSDDYDMDLVCLLENGQALSLGSIKNLVGNRLKEHKLYSKMLEREGHRCWTMQYDEFHMDILPCVPKYSFFSEPYLTEIKLTHKNDQDVYEPRFSNPYGYHEWFEKQMKVQLDLEKRVYAQKNKIEIDKVPTYLVRTPLQKTIQILKRHRDICFQDDSDNAPISIIITTLAALAYDGESNVYEAICNILNNMHRYIECRNGVYWIQNPVMADENFADKWSVEPEKKTAFFFWLAKAKKELITNPLENIGGLANIADGYKSILGKAPVERAIKTLGDETRAARASGSLYVNGLSGGLSLQKTASSRPVKEHTFFGE